MRITQTSAEKARGAKLLPCAHCGGVAKLGLPYQDGSTYAMKTCCTNCGVNVVVQVLHGELCENIVEKWNRRAAPQWTKEPPTEAGWYMVKRDLFPDEIVEVDQFAGEWVVRSFCAVEELSAFEDVLWCKIDLL